MGQERGSHEPGRTGVSVVIDNASQRAPVRRLGPSTTALLVVANIVGTGIFTTTGFLVRDLGSPLVVLLAWALGGLFALCGALAYGELAAAIPRNGGEYTFLSRIYHPAAGFVAGWISLVVGFSAPIAASALAFGHYLHAVMPAVPITGAALILVALLSLLHTLHVQAGSGVQNILAALKIGLITVFIAGGLLWGDPGHIFTEGGRSVSSALLSPAFAVGLIFVSFAYSGWNAAAYLAGEVRAPGRTLPLALLFGTSIVVVLYLGLNIAFLSSAPSGELAGVVEVGHVAAVRLFGERAGSALSGLIALALVSWVSAMIMAGPRVYEAVGVDHPRLSFLGRRTRLGGPGSATALQAAVAAGMILTASFGALLTYIGFTLSLCAGATVVGVAVLRRREPGLARPYRTWGYPFTPLLFVGLCTWMVVHSLVERPIEAIAGLVTIAAGLLLYRLFGNMAGSDGDVQGE